MLDPHSDPRLLSLILSHQLRRNRARDAVAAKAIGLQGYLPATGHVATLATLVADASDERQVLNFVSMASFVAMQAIEAKRGRLREIRSIIRGGVESNEYKRTLLIEAENILSEIAGLAETMEKIEL